MSKKDVLKLLEECDACFVRALFGTFEGYVRISKQEARRLIRSSWSESTDASYIPQTSELFLESK